MWCLYRVSEALTALNCKAGQLYLEPSTTRGNKGELISGQLYKEQSGYCRVFLKGSHRQGSAGQDDVIYTDIPGQFTGST